MKFSKYFYEKIHQLSQTEVHVEKIANLIPLHTKE